MGKSFLVGDTKFSVLKKKKTIKSADITHKTYLH